MPVIDFMPPVTVFLSIYTTAPMFNRRDEANAPAQRCGIDIPAAFLYPASTCLAAILKLNTIYLPEYLRLLNFFHGRI